MFAKIILQWLQKIIDQAFSKIISMFARFTIRKANFKNYQASWIENFKNFEIHFRCCEYSLFRCNSFVRYSEIRFTSRDSKFLSTFAKYSNQLSRKKVIRVVIWMFSWFCIDLIQTTTRKRTRNRQKKFKRMIRNFDQCIFIETFCEIFDSDFCFVCFFLVAISFVFELFRVFFVIDTFVTTYSDSLSKSRL